jgi:hypothetical protein
LTLSDLHEAIAEKPLNSGKKKTPPQADAASEAPIATQAAPGGADEAPAAAPGKIDPELAKKLAEFRRHLQENFAKVVISLMATPRYKHCSLSELEQLVLDPLLRNRIAIAQAKPKENAAPSQDDAVAGIAIWAKVSPEVDEGGSVKGAGRQNRAGWQRRREESEQPAYFDSCWASL